MTSEGISFFMGDMKVCVCVCVCVCVFKVGVSPPYPSSTPPPPPPPHPHTHIPTGMKESYEKSVSRLLSFGHYAFNLSDYPPLKKLFESERFLSEVKHVCPASHQYLDPFQFNFIIQIPGGRPVQF